MTASASTAAHDKVHADRITLLMGVLLLALLVLRLWMMAALPLTDSTEARYGDLSRLVAEQGWWLMPHVDAQTPFFAKPALSIWIGAASALLFGVSEFALRLPHLLVTLAAMAALWLATAGLPRNARLLALFVFASAPLAFISAGAVMTDATQMACVAWAMVAAWQLLFRRAGSRGWQLAFWAACGFGALAKGLATLALIGLPLALYAVTGGGIMRCWRALWSGRGLVLFIVIAVPWYVAAERAYPGFLQYFFVGEHFMRFIDPGWKGDRYGNAHNEPLGSIWVYWAAAVLPWLAAFAAQLWALAGPARWRAAGDATRWWWCWVLAPLLFFTFTRNLIWTYALTAIPPFAVATAYWWAGRSGRAQTGWLAVGATLLVVLLAAAVTLGPAAMENRSARALVREADRQGRTPQQPIVLGAVYSFSTGYYTKGNVVHVQSIEGFGPWLARPGSWLIVPNGEVETLRRQGPVRVVKAQDRASLLQVMQP
jgi:4-amino-4-deoxy-L-arabinose transferase-like glycosyltransferase